MNISRDELSLMYEGYASSQKLADGAKCPSMEELSASTKAVFFSRKRTSLHRHVVDCPECAKKIKLLLRLHLEAEDVGRAVDKLRSPEKASPFGPRRPAVQAAAFFFGLAFLGLSLWTVFGGGRLGESAAERQGPRRIQKWKIFEPVGHIRKPPSLIFRWKYSGNAEGFLLELFDERLALVAKIDDIPSSAVELPGRILDGLRPGRPYFWMVTAYLRSKPSGESDLNRFMIRPDS